MARKGMSAGAVRAKPTGTRCGEEEEHRVPVGAGDRGRREAQSPVCEVLGYPLRRPVNPRRGLHASNALLPRGGVPVQDHRALGLRGSGVGPAPGGLDVGAWVTIDGMDAIDRERPSRSPRPDG
jgi:hypothetical protein